MQFVVDLLQFACGGEHVLRIVGRVENDAAESVGLDFFSNCVDWMVKKQAVLDISPKIPQQYGLSLSPMQGRTVGWMALFFIPGAALVLAVFTWLSRRK